MKAHKRFPDARGLTLSDRLVSPTMADIKTKTRRLLRPQPPSNPLRQSGKRWGLVNGALYYCDVRSPFNVGQILYVRETHYCYGHWALTGELTRTGKPKWGFVPDSKEVRFEAPNKFYRARRRGHENVSCWYKRLARFMPKEYARTYLEVVGIHVERLNAISEADAKAEGAEPYDVKGLSAAEIDLLDAPLKDPATPYRNGFAMLWESIHGINSWATNPYVWVIEFKRIT
jgi:hypothetical protein